MTKKIFLFFNLEIFFIFNLLYILLFPVNSLSIREFISNYISKLFSLVRGNNIFKLNQNSLLYFYGKLIGVHVMYYIFSGWISSYSIFLYWIYNNKKIEKFAKVPLCNFSGLIFSILCYLYFSSKAKTRNINS